MRKVTKNNNSLEIDFAYQLSFEEIALLQALLRKQVNGSFTQNRGNNLY